MKFKLPMLFIQTKKHIFSEPVYVYKVPFIYLGEMYFNGLSFKQSNFQSEYDCIKKYMSKKEMESIKDEQFYMVTMEVKNSQYKKFIEDISSYFRTMKMYNYIPIMYKKAKSAEYVIENFGCKYITV